MSSIREQVLYITDKSTAPASQVSLCHTVTGTMTSKHPVPAFITRPTARRAEGEFSSSTAPAMSTITSQIITICPAPTNISMLPMQNATMYYYCCKFSDLSARDTTANLFFFVLTGILFMSYLRLLLVILLLYYCRITAITAINSYNNNTNYNIKNNIILTTGTVTMLMSQWQPTVRIHPMYLMSAEQHHLLLYRETSDLGL